MYVHVQYSKLRTYTRTTHGKAVCRVKVKVKEKKKKKKKKPPTGIYYAKLKGAPGRLVVKALKLLQIDDDRKTRLKLGLLGGGPKHRTFRKTAVEN